MKSAYSPHYDATFSAVNTVVRFFRHLDDRNYAAMVSLLHPEGVWHRQGLALTGRDAVLQALARRSPTMQIHHLLTNLCAEPGSEHDVAVSAYMLVVRHDDGNALTGPAPLSGIANIRTTRASLRMTDNGWAILSLASDPPTFAAAA